MSEKRASQIIIGSAVAGIATVAALSNSFVSGVANIGEATNVALLLKTDGAVTFTLQASDDLLPGAGRNLLDTTNTLWFDYVRASSYEASSGVLGNEAKIVLAGAGLVAIDLSPFAPKYLRLVSANGVGINGFASIVTSG